MSDLTIARLLTVAVVCCGTTPFAGLLLFMLYQSRQGRAEKPKRKAKPDEAGW